MIVDFKDYEHYINDENDVSIAILNALQECRKHENSKLVFPKGEYHIFSSKCFEKTCYISNNDHGIKRIAFPLMGMKNLTIDGNGSEFIFHGALIPFLVDTSNNIVIQNLKIDYKRPFFSQGEILEAGHTEIVLKIDSEQFPFRIEDEQIIFYGDEYENSYIKWFVEFDPRRKALAYGIGDTDLRIQKVKANLIHKDIVKFNAYFKQKHTVGNIIAITHEQRNNPGIVITESENVRLENIDVYHASAMAIIGQLSKDISLNNVNVAVRPGSTRMVSSNNDATHFVNCEGKIKFENCIFENQLDDATNIHGMYNCVSTVYSNESIVVKVMHFQQHGINIFRKGDRIAVVDQGTLLHKGYVKVLDIIVINREYIQLKIQPENGIKIENDDLVENFERMPEIEIRGCRVGNNRARGFIVASSKQSIIEENTFYNSAAGVLIGCGAVKWYESGAVSDVTIRNNKFLNCGYGGNGSSAILISPVIDESYGLTDFEKNIRIHSNEFHTFEPNVLKASLVQGLEFNNNTVKCNDEFKPFGTRKQCIDVKNCKDISIINNEFEGFDEYEGYDLDEISNSTACINENKFK